MKMFLLRRAFIAGKPGHGYDSDPGPMFMDPKVQSLLRNLTRTEADKIFRKRSVPKASVEFKFMTTEQIQQEVERSFREGERLLQMPPVVKIRDEPIRTISQDPALTDFSESKYLFTDITYGVPDSNRVIVCRHQDGTLTTVDQETRKRVNHLYFPLNGRQIRVPKLFTDATLLKECLDMERYEFVLDYLTVQFEPYERQFHEICAQVYQHIDEHKRFDSLRSTRHFGPMVFFLAWHKMVDNLLLDMIKRDFLANAVELISLASQLNKWPPINEASLEGITFDQFNVDASTEEATASNLTRIVGKSRHQLDSDRICLDLIQEYCKERATKKVQLELALQTYREQMDHQVQLLEGLQRAHGTNASSSVG